MNTVNFINPLPPKKQKEIIRWYQYSLALICLTMCTLTVVTIYQYIQVKKLHNHYNTLKNTNTLRTIENHLTHIKTLKAELQKKVQKINALKQHMKNPHSLLSSLSEVIPGNAQLLQYTLRGHSLELEGQALNTDAVLTFLKLLNQSPLYKKIHITSMTLINTDTQHMVHFKIKGFFYGV